MTSPKGIKYNPDRDSYSLRFDPNSDGLITPKEIAEISHPDNLWGIVHTIDYYYQTDADGIHDFIETVAKIDGLKGRLLEHGYLEHGNLEFAKALLRRNYEKNPIYQGHIWEKMEDTENGRTGGIKHPPEVLTIGTGLSLTPQEEIDSLIKRYRTQIEDNPALLDAIGEIAQDSETFKLLSHFLENGGRIDTRPDSGKYDSNPLAIHVGLGTPKKTLFHELQHYWFDVTDSYLFEIHAVGGLDHQVIEPLEERFRLIQAVRSGKGIAGESFFTWGFDLDNPNLPSDLDSHRMYFSNVANIRRYQRYRIDQAQGYREFNGLIGKRQFYIVYDPFNFSHYEYKPGNDEIVVHLRSHSMLAKAALASFNLTDSEQSQLEQVIQTMLTDPQFGKKESYLTRTQSEDVVYLHAINIAMVKELLRLAFAIAKRDNLSGPKEVFAKKEYITMADLFIKKFLLSIKTDPRQKLHIATRQTMDEIFTTAPQL